MILTSEKLDQILRQLPLSDMIVRSWVDGWRLVALVASPDFEGKNGAVRQAQIWRHIHEHLGYGEASRVAFIFTVTVKELETYEAIERKAIAAAKLKASQSAAEGDPSAPAAPAR